jgi:transposase
MRKVREIFRLGMACHAGNREIARSCMVSHATVGSYLSRAQKAGLSYPEIEKLDDMALKRIILNDKAPKGKDIRPQPDWSLVHQELKKKGVTLGLLWEEHKEIHSNGYQSSQFYERYNRWRKKLNVSLRQTHKVGEKLFVDYAGQSMPVRDRRSGKTKEAQIFVAVLGATNYTYSEATLSQGLSDWINSHVRAFEYFGGAPQIVVPDNLKSGVTKPCWYEPDINPTYHDLAVHYGTVIIPTRVRKPKDKAKVEGGVLLAERWILAALRNRTFFSLAELNKAIFQLLEKLNNRPFKKLEGSRWSCFESMERQTLLPLPPTCYVFSEWKKAKANIDYHVELKGHYYSVPYALVHESVDIRYTNTTVEIFFRSNRVASHRRSYEIGRHTTVEEHMPKSHREFLKWNPSRIIHWAKTAGKFTAEVVESIMASRKHPEQGYRSCMGIMRLGKRYSNERLEAACNRALAIRTLSYKSIQSILEKGLDRQPLSHPSPNTNISHENIRGRNYFSPKPQKG